MRSAMFKWHKTFKLARAGFVVCLVAWVVSLYAYVGFSGNSCDLSLYQGRISATWIRAGVRTGPIAGFQLASTTGGEWPRAAQRSIRTEAQQALALSRPDEFDSFWVPISIVLLLCLIAMARVRLGDARLVNARDLCKWRSFVTRSRVMALFFFAAGLGMWIASFWYMFRWDLRDRTLAVHLGHLEAYPDAIRYVVLVPVPNRAITDSWRRLAPRISTAGRNNLQRFDCGTAFRGLMGHATFVPLAPIVVLAAIPLVVPLLRRRRLPVGLCATCGYDLRGNVSGRCPECGATHHEHAAAGTES